MSTAKLLFRGAGLQVLMMIVSVGSSFFLAPFVIHSLGDRWYGLWVLVGSFIGFYGLLDFGISSATQRYLAHAIPRNDPEELNTIIAASLTMFCGISVVVLLVTAGITLSAPLFISNPRDITTFREVIGIMGASFALSVPFYTQHGILAANIRLDYAAYLQIGKTITRTLLFFLILGLGYGIVALSIVSISVDILSFGAVWLVARRLAPWMALRRRHFSFEKMRELIGFGLYAFVGQVAGTLKFKLDNLVIAGTLGLASVTHFNIATKLNGYYFGFLGRLVPAPTSIYARYHAKGEIRQIREKFLILSRINIICGVLGMGCVLLFARPFIELWVGKAYLDAFIPLVILMVGRLGSITQRPATGVIYALAKQRFTAFMNLGEAIVNLALSLLFVHWYGIAGVALGTAIPLLFTRLTIQPVYVCHIMGLALSRFVKELVPLLLATMVVQLPLAYALTKVQIHSYWQIAAWAAGYYIPLLLFFYAVMLKPEERGLFMEALPSFLKWRPGRAGEARKHTL